MEIAAINGAGTRTSVGSQTYVLVPVKDWSQAKARLSARLSPTQRYDLAKSLASHVVEAADGLPVAIVCDSQEVKTWAQDKGLIVLNEPGIGLNSAIRAGVLALRGLGASQVIIAHADLALAQSLAWVGQFGGCTIVPDTKYDGTNVLCLPLDAPRIEDFEFSYGPGSFAKHFAQAHKLGAGVRVAPDQTLGYDLDTIADLAGLTNMGWRL